MEDKKEIAVDMGFWNQNGEYISDVQNVNIEELLQGFEVPECPAYSKNYKGLCRVNHFQPCECLKNCIIKQIFLLCKKEIVCNSCTWISTDECYPNNCNFFFSVQLAKQILNLKEEK